MRWLFAARRRRSEGIVLLPISPDEGLHVTVDCLRRGSKRVMGPLRRARCGGEGVVSRLHRGNRSEGIMRRRLSRTAQEVVRRWIRLLHAVQAEVFVLLVGFCDLVPRRLRNGTRQRVVHVDVLHSVLHTAHLGYATERRHWRTVRQHWTVRRHVVMLECRWNVGWLVVMVAVVPVMSVVLVMVTVVLVMVALVAVAVVMSMTFRYMRGRVSLVDSFVMMMMVMRHVRLVVMVMVVVVLLLWLVVVMVYRHHLRMEIVVLELRNVYVQVMAVNTETLYCWR